MPFVPPPVIDCINGRLRHVGPCRVSAHGYFLVENNGTLPASRALEAIITLLGGLEEDDIAADIATVRPLLARDRINSGEERSGLCDVTPEEAAALRRLSTEAEEYWDVNNYATDDIEEDRHLAQARVSGLSVCWNQDWIREEVRL